MKARDKVRTSALRMAISGVRNAAVEAGVGPGGELDDEKVRRILATHVKQREESAEAFREAGRGERAEQEETEAEILRGYLPDPLDDDELGAIIDGVIEDVAASGMQDMGPVMGRVMDEVGTRAEGSHVSELVRGRLRDRDAE